MIDETSPYSRLFTNKRTGQTRTVTIWMPVDDSKPEGPLWRSKFSVTTAEGVTTRDAYGADWLHALLMAVEGATLDMAKDEADWETPEQTPLWMFRPEAVSISWGYEFFDKCRQLIRDEDRRFQDAIERRVRSKRSDAARTTAEARLAMLTRLGEHINEMTALIDEFPDAEEQRQLRRPLGNLLVELVERMQPIYRAYPDLDPDRPDDEAT